MGCEFSCVAEDVIARNALKSVQPCACLYCTVFQSDFGALKCVWMPS